MYADAPFQRLYLACPVLLRGDSDACDTSQADPGETYDPLNLTDNPDTFAELRVNETKSSSSCYYMQAIVICEGGVQYSHISARYSSSGPCLPLQGTPVVMLTACGRVSHTQHVLWGTSPRAAGTE